MNGSVAGGVKQRIKLAADHGVSAGPSLQFNLAPNRLAGRLTVRMKIDGAVVAFDDGDGAARFQTGFEDLQRPDGPREVFEDKTEKDVVEEGRRIRQMEKVRLFALNVGQTRRGDSSPGFGDGRLGYVHGSDQGARTVLRQGESLSANTATGFENTASRRVGGVGVEQVEQCRGLGLKTPVLPTVVAVDVCFIHRLEWYHGHVTVSRGGELAKRGRWFTIGIITASRMKFNHEIIVEVQRELPADSSLGRQVGELCSRLEAAGARVEELERENAAMKAARPGAPQKETEISQEMLRGIAGMMRSGARPTDD